MDLLKMFNSIDSSNNYLIVGDEFKDNIVTLKSSYEIRLNKLFKFNVLSEAEFINLVSFSVDDEIYLNNLNNNIPVSITKELIKFSRYNLENKNVKLNTFYESNKKYLNKNKVFLNNMSAFKFYMLGNDSFIRPFMDYYKLNYTLLDIDVDSKIETYEFINKETEVFYLFECISKELKEGVSISNIYIANTDESYLSYLTKFSMFYNIPVNKNLNKSLYDYKVVKELFKYDYNKITEILSNDNLLIDLFKEYIKLDEELFYNLINEVINIINKYPNNFNDKLIKEVVLSDLKNKQISNKLTNAVNLITYNEILGLNNESIVYILNSKYESFPVLAKNNELLTDNDKEVINYPTSSILNSKRNQYLEKIIKLKQIKYLSFSKKDKYSEYDKSDIFNKYTNNTYTHIDIENLNIGYSNDYYRSYFKDVGSDILLTTFSGDFKVSEEERKLLNKYILNREIKLTPSSITTYFKIPFIFYLERILRVSRFSESVNLRIGNFFHSLVEVMYVLLFEEKVTRSNDFSFNEKINQQIVNYIIKKEVTDEFNYSLFFDEFLDIYYSNYKNSSDTLDIESLFFIKKNKEMIIESLVFLIDYETLNPSDLILVEKRVELDNFIGVSDLVKVYNNNYSIVDYKTGNRDAFNKDKIFNVIDSLLNGEDVLKIKDLDLLQPVFYAYFLEKLENNYKFSDVGFLSIFKDKQQLNSLMSESVDSSFYTGGKNRFINKEELEELFSKIEELIKLTNNNILNSIFNVKVLKDIDNKEDLSKSWFSVYEALAFYNKPEEDNYEEE